jgi:hypothetical protein
MPKGNPKKPPGSKKSALPPKLLSSWGFVIFGACGVALAIVMPHLLKYLFPHPEPKPRVDNGATQQQQQQSSPKAVCAEDGPPEHEMCLAWHKAGYCRAQRRAASDHVAMLSMPAGNARASRVSKACMTGISRRRRPGPLRVAEDGVLTPLGRRLHHSWKRNNP